MRINRTLRKLFIYLSPLIVGIVSGALTHNAMKTFETINKPTWAPDGWLFPVVWTILYILMGIAAYEAYVREPSVNRTLALTCHIVQLILNFFWSIIFFLAGEYLFALIWLAILLISVICMAFNYYKISKVSFFLSIPYILWLSFAAYLNLMIYILN